MLPFLRLNNLLPQPGPSLRLCHLRSVCHAEAWRTPRHSAKVVHLLRYVGCFGEPSLVVSLGTLAPMNPTTPLSLQGFQARSAG